MSNSKISVLVIVAGVLLYFWRCPESIILRIQNPVVVLSPRGDLATDTDRIIFSSNPWIYGCVCPEVKR